MKIYLDRVGINFCQFPFFFRKVASFVTETLQTCSTLYNFLLILASSLASVSIHMLLKKTLSVPLSSWNLIFWRGLFQVIFSVLFIIKDRKRRSSTFPVSKYHLISVSFPTCNMSYIHLKISKRTFFPDILLVIFFLFSLQKKLGLFWIFLCRKKSTKN